MGITLINGKPFKTERAAIQARKATMLKVHTELSAPPKRKRATVSEVYTEYCATGRCGKAYGTTRKQDSLWKNHIDPKFTTKGYQRALLKADAKAARDNSGLRYWCL